MISISIFDNLNNPKMEIEDLIERGCLDEAWALIMENNYDLDISRLISLTLSMSGYSSNLFSLPTRRSKDYIDLAGALATIDVDIDDHILYALSHTDLAMLEFLINRGYTNICEIIDLSDQVEGSEEVVQSLSTLYDIDECYESE